MTSTEHDDEINRYLRQFADNEKTLVCLRERLRGASRALDALKLDSDRFATEDEAERAAKYMIETTGEVHENLTRYAVAIERRKHFRSILSQLGYGSFIKD